MNNLTSTEYLKWVQQLQSEEFQITKSKNSDYSGTELAFGNFDMVEKLGICSAETGILVRITDKIARIVNLMSNRTERQVADEKLEDTLTDLVNYARILNIYMLTKDRGTVENSVDTRTDS